MKITTAEQFEILVAELEKNPSLAKGFYKGHVLASCKGDWENISIKLNAIGPPVRDSIGWQRGVVCGPHKGAETIVGGEPNNNAGAENEQSGNIEVENEQIETSVVEEAPRSSKKSNTKRSKNEIYLMVEEQTKREEQHHDETRKILNEINNSLKDSVRYQRKRFQIEEEKLNILKKKAKKDEEDRKLDTALKNKKLELIEEQLEALKNNSNMQLFED